MFVFFLMDLFLFGPFEWSSDLLRVKKVIHRNHFCIVVEMMNARLSQ